MDKPTLVYMLIESVLFLVPLAVLFIKVGGYKKMVEDMAKKTENLPEWKATVDTKVTQLELSNIAQQNTLESINKSIIAISTKMDLLLDNKIKVEK